MLIDNVIIFPRSQKRNIFRTQEFHLPFRSIFGTYLNCSKTCDYSKNPDFDGYAGLYALLRQTLRETLCYEYPCYRLLTNHLRTNLDQDKQNMICTFGFLTIPRITHKPNTQHFSVKKFTDYSITKQTSCSEKWVVSYLSAFTSVRGNTVKQLL